jgi:hypothetical protein
VLLKEKASLEDIIIALFHAYIARKLLSNHGYRAFSILSSSTSSHQSLTSNIPLVEQSLRILRGVECFDNMELGPNEYRSFSRSLELSKDWSIEEMHLETRKARLILTDS